MRKFLSIGLATLVALAAPAQAVYAARPVAYSWYAFPSGSTFDRYEVVLTIEEAPASGRIYPAFQFAFEQLDANGLPIGGYFGLQLFDTGKKALFSIWDTAEQSNSAQPDSSAPQCRRFGSEGTGTQCLVDFNWEKGRAYRFRLVRTVAGAQAQVWSLLVQDTVTGTETTIGAIRLSGGGSLPGYGELRDYAVSWVEYFGGPDTCDAQPYVRVRWEGPYGGSQRALPVTARNARNACQTANSTSPGRPFVVQEVGGTITGTTPADASLWPPVNFSRSLYLPRLERGWFEIEPNNTPAQATGPMRSGTSMRGAHDDARDYFYVDLKDGDGLQASLSTTQTGVQLQIRPASDINRLLAIITGPPYDANLAPQPAGRYYILVFSEVPQAAQTYTLHVTYP